MSKKNISVELENKLHKTLKNKNKKLSLQEIKQLIYELRNDSLDLYNKEFLKLVEANPRKQDYQNVGFYDGEHNAFQIALDLLEHLEK
jgi:hypothetical protein